MATPNLPIREQVAALESAFADPCGSTVGVEEEVLLLDPLTFDLLPEAERLVPLVPGAALEMPAAQLELLTAPHATVGAACTELLAARRRLVDVAGGTTLAGAAGVHPFSAAEGVLNRKPRYEAIEREFAWAARRQLCFGLHVHVAVRPAARALAVFNALRSFLPELAALGANAPVYEGRDSGLASVRPKLAQLLPRQGVPPAFDTLEDLAAAYAWGMEAGVMGDAGQWWWEARLHPRHGTIEVRVPDAQTTVAEVGMVAAVVHALVTDLGDRLDAGEPLHVAPSWQIAQNSWSACRHGLGGTLADLVTGRPTPTCGRLGALLDGLVPTAERLGCADELATAREAVERGVGGADRQRAVLRENGPTEVARWLASRFLHDGDPHAVGARPDRSATLPAG